MRESLRDSRATYTSSYLTIRFASALSAFNFSLASPSSLSDSGGGVMTSIDLETEIISPGIPSSFLAFETDTVVFIGGPCLDFGCVITTVSTGGGDMVGYFRRGIRIEQVEIFWATRRKQIAQLPIFLGFGVYLEKLGSLSLILASLFQPSTQPPK
jgi:hypothetical protein